MSAVEKMRVRKKPARRADIILAAIDERLQMIDQTPHTIRLLELMEELRRSLNKNAPESDTE